MGQQPPYYPPAGPPQGGSPPPTGPPPTFGVPPQPQWPSQYPPQPPRPSNTNAIIVVVGVVGLIVVAAIAAVVIGLAAIGKGGPPVRATPTPPAGPVTATTTLQATRGAVVFTDDFHDASSGWPTFSTGTTFTYKDGHYVVVARGGLDYYADSPYSNPVSQISSTVTGTQADGASSGAGFGAYCLRGTGDAVVRYEFVVLVGGRWSVDRRDGAISPTIFPIPLKGGSSVAAPGNAPLTVVAVCATLGDGQSTRLVLFVAGSKVADITDKPKAALPTDGWYAGLLFASSATAPNTVTVTHFDSRDLAR